MKVHELMTPNPAVVASERTAAEAARLMRDLDVGGLPVVERERFAGMVTDRDVALRVVGAGKDPRATPVWEVLSPDLLYCEVDTEVEQAAQLMRQREVRRLPVVDHEGVLVGVLSLADLAGDPEARPLAAHLLQSVSAAPPGVDPAPAYHGP